MPLACGGKSQGGLKYRLKLSQEIQNYKLPTESTELTLLRQVLSINKKQFCGHEGKGAYPLTCDSVHGSISQVRSFRGYDPLVMTECPRRPRKDINTAGPRAQALATPRSARAHPTREPGHTRKTRSCIMMGKTVAAVLILLLISALGTQGKETLPKALLINGQSKC